MATSKITIEVDYRDSVAKVGQLEMSFKELENSAVKSRKAIQKAIQDTDSVLKGSLKSLAREKAALVETQSTLARNNEEYRKYQRQIMMIDKEISRLTDTRNKEEVALKNSANGLKQQIALIQQEMNNRKLSNTQYRLMQEEIDKLEAKHASLTNTVKAGTVAAYEQQIAELQRYQREVATTSQEMEEAEQKIVSLRNRMGDLAQGTRMATKAQEGMSSSAGAAGATVTEFGRTIGDAPFGLMGMANNLQQLSQQFVDLQAKSGGTRAAFQSIMQTLMGPAGFVVAINIITSAIVAYNMRKDEAKEKTEDFNDALILEKNTLEALASIYAQSNKGLEDRANVMGAIAAADDKFAEALDSIGISEEKRNKLTQEYLVARAKLNKAEAERNKFADENKEALAEEVLSLEEREKIETALANLWDQRRAAQTSAEANALATSISQLTHRLKVDNDRIKVNEELVKNINNVSDAEKELNDVLGNSEMDKFMEKLADFEKERSKTRSLLGLEGSAAIQKEIRLLQDDYSKAVRKFGNESVQAKEALLEVDKKRLELEVALYEESKENGEEQKDRLKSLAEFNQELLDNLETQFDEYGLIRINQQERQAMQEAKALGASVETLMNITKFYEGERKKIVMKIDEEIAEEQKKIREKGLKENLDKIKDFYDKQVELMKTQSDQMMEIVSNFTNLIDELGGISEARFQRQINMLKEERDIIKHNDALTREEKDRQLTEIQERENAIQKDRINAEYRIFAVKQMFNVMEMVMKERSAFREKQLLIQKSIIENKMRMESMIQEQLKAGLITGLQAQVALTGVNLDAAKNLAGANMSLGTYMAQLGPLGKVAWALSIGSVIASIIGARKNANAEIAGLSNVPISSGGGGAAASVPPDFNVVGESELNQLGQAITGAQQQPVKAYVVASDVSGAQELDRKILESASI